MEITEAEAPHRVRIDLRFDKPFKAQNDLQFLLHPEGSGTRVTWTMTGKRTLMLRLMGVFKSMDAMIGPDFERGLARLKAVAE